MRRPRARAVVWLALVLAFSTPARGLEVAPLERWASELGGVLGGEPLAQIQNEGGPRVSGGLTWERWVEELESQVVYVVRSGLLLPVGFFVLLFGLGGAAFGGARRGCLVTTLGPSLTFLLYPLWGAAALFLGFLAFLVSVAAALLPSVPKDPDGRLRMGAGGRNSADDDSDGGSSGEGGSWSGGGGRSGGGGASGGW